MCDISLYFQELWMDYFCEHLEWIMLGLVPLNPIVWCYVCYYVWHYVWLNVVINKVSLLLLSKIMVTWIDSGNTTSKKKKMKKSLLG